METPQPQFEHEWLHQLVGEWTSEAEAEMGPGQPPQTFTGADSVRSVGGLWIICEGRSEMPGGGIGTHIITLGYDPTKQKFVGSFVGSMMTEMWVYEGTLDSDRKVLTLATEGPSFSDKSRMCQYHDIIEIHSAEHRTLTSEFLGEDGAWHRFMTAHYRRSAK